MREVINKYGVFVGIAALLISTAGIYLHLKRQPAAQPMSENSPAFYVDEVTNEESVHSVSELPPLVGKGGNPSVVRAIKVTYDGGKTSRIVYLEKFTPEAQERLRNLAPDDPQRDTFEGRLVRLPGADSPWVPANSAQGIRIRENVANSDNGTPMIYLPPANRS